MFTRTDKKSMIIQALMVSPELRDVVWEGLGYVTDEASGDLVRECYDKVQEIKARKPSPPPLPLDAFEPEPTLFDRFFKRK